MNKILGAFTLFIGISFAVYSQTPDPGIAGPLSVLSMEYDFGDEAFDPPSFPDLVEVTGNVHYPEGLADGPYPVLLFLHGRHSTCYSPAGFTSISWPCTGSFSAIPSYQGYNYLAEFFASHGYIVISISANSISSTDNFVSDYGMQARGELIQHHLDLWNEWNTVGGDPFDDTFVGKLDMTNIGTMGHSRGGEGVIFNALYNRSLGSPYGINAVLTLAPVDFNRQILPHTTQLNIAPYCDGDVSDLQGVHFYDDVRYAEPTDTTAKHNLLLNGANHNFFNTVWTPGLFAAGTADDWGFVDFSQSDDHCGTSSFGNGRLDPEEQRNALQAYAGAFFRYYIGGESEFAPILNTDDVIPPATATLDDDEVFMSFHPSNKKMARLNSLVDEGKEDFNDLGGEASASGLSTYDICGDDLAEQYCLGVGTSQEPHSKSGGLTMPGLSQLLIEWASPDGYYSNELPPAFQDLSQFDAIQFRAAHDFTVADDFQDYSVRLTDFSGATSLVKVSDISNAMYYPPGDIGTTLPRAMHNTIKIPLELFTGIDLTAVTSIDILFDVDASGSILVSDILLSSDELVFLPPIADFESNVVSTCTGVVQFTDLSVFFPSEWLWEFGDGTTSDESNPEHTYLENGIYTVSLTVSNPAGSDIATYTSLIEVNRPLAPEVETVNVCIGDTALPVIIPSSSGSILWYESVEAISEFAEGESISYYTETDISLYAEEVVSNPIVSVGPEDNTFGSGSDFDGNDLRGIFFNVFSPFVLESVLVYAGSSGDRTIQVLASEGGPVVHSLTVPMVSGEQVIDLGFVMEPGIGYYIKVTGDLVDLFRINDGSPDYPYEVPGIVALTGSNVDGAEEDYYYFFFNWQIREPDCVSPRVEVPISVHPFPVVTTSDDVSILPGESTVLSASGGSTYSWLPTDGLSDPTSASPTASPESTTTYVVTVTNEFDCAATDTVVITVLEGNSISFNEEISIELYPNPADDFILVSGFFGNSDVVINNILGEVVGTYIITTEPYQIDLEQFSPGMYQITWTDERGMGSKLFVVE